MVRCLIWGTGKAFSENAFMFDWYEEKKLMQIIGVTSNEKYYSKILKWKFIDKHSIDINLFDFLIIAARDNACREIEKEAKELGIEAFRIVPYKVMQLQGFDFKKYEAIKKDTPTIFAPNCWGGLTYHSLGLQFQSPFINMFELDEDYIRFLNNPKYYIECPLILREMYYEPNLGYKYPIAECGDILLRFNHYKSFDEANECWERRKRRIKWDNIFVMFFCEKKDMVEEFLKLPYEKKICFVPYETQTTTLMGINCHKSEFDLSTIINHASDGTYMFYNVFDLLLMGKVNRVSELNWEYEE